MVMLGQCFSGFNVHSNHPDLKCRCWFCKSSLDPEILPKKISKNGQWYHRTVASQTLSTEDIVTEWEWQTLCCLRSQDVYISYCLRFLLLQSESTGKVFIFNPVQSLSILSWIFNSQGELKSNQWIKRMDLSRGEMKNIRRSLKQ